MTDAELETELANWSAWYRWHRRGRGQAESMEGGYRSPQHWDVLPVTKPPATDAAAAQRLELAVCSIDLWAHSLLRYWFIEKFRPEKVCRLVKKVSGRDIRFSDFDAALGEARHLLLIELSLPATTRKARALDRVQAIKREHGTG